jgi:hypothetical protein
LRKSVQRCRADPFKHAAVVCCPVADALVADPFALLLLRGRPRDEVLAALRARRCSGDMEGDATGTVGPAIDPRSSRRGLRRVLAPLRTPPLPPQRPGRPAVLLVDPPSGSGMQPDDLVALAADAVARLGAATGDGGLSLNLEADLARRAAGLLGAGVG